MSPHAKYFQGSSVTGSVRASSAASWKDLVDCFRICPTLPLTRSAFLALDKKSRNEAKQVPFFVPACFRESPSKRVYAEATVCNLIMIDVDDSKDAAPFVKNPQLLYDALEGFNFLAHTTASSTPENPRMRIIVMAEEIPVERYAQAVETIGARLALSHITKESKVAVQAMYNPVMFSDSTEEQHPLIAQEQNGRAFTVNDISDEEECDGNSSNGSNGTNGHIPHGTVSPHGADALFFLKSPVPEISLAIAKEALAEIDADCDRAEWRDIASALKHQFSPHKAEEAYQLFDEWSATGDKYEDQDDTKKMWESLRPTPVGRMPVTIRSLLHKAVAAGWSDQRVKDHSFNKLLEWMEHVPTATELLEQGVQKILTAPLLSNVQEDMLIDELKKHVKRRFAIVVATATIKKDLMRVKAQIQAEAQTEVQEKQKKQEPMWAKGVLYVSNTQEFYRRRTGEKYRDASFDACYGRWLLPTAQDLIAQGKQVNTATLSQPIVQPSDYARNYLKITTVTDYSYDPSQPNELFFIDRGKKFVNIYNPTYPELDPRHAKEAGALFEGHLNNLIGEPDYRRTLIDFMAFLVQSPGRKVRWSPIIQGAEGCGKTFLAEAIKAVLGKEHVKTIDGTTVVSGWNEWAFGYQLVVLEEVRVQGTNRHDIMNRLKPWITNEDIPVSEKFRSSRDIRNITNYMMFSNAHDALALTPSDRRYFVIKSPLQTKQQVLALGKDYFKALFRMLEKHPGALRAWLAEWPISDDFEPNGHAPRTKYVGEMVEDSASDLLAAVRRLLIEGDYPLVQYDLVSAKFLLDVIHQQDGMGHTTGQQLAHVLREEGFNQMGRFAFGEERHYLWLRGGCGMQNVFEVAVERVKKDAKNLCMELLF